MHSRHKDMQKGVTTDSEKDGPEKKGRVKNSSEKTGSGKTVPKNSGAGKKSPVKHGSGKKGTGKRGSGKKSRGISDGAGSHDRDDESPVAVRAGNITPRVVARPDHNVSRSSISKHALKVLYRLKNNGYEAYLVGGGVRDILTGLQPKDFDVATDATPAQLRKLFRHSRIIGRRFRLVHVIFGREIIEVATFRAAHDSGDGGEIGDGGRILRDNVFGSIEDDAIRRDFTVNALYYNVADFSVVDYVGGLDDIERKQFRLIGDPVKRCEEDPVRIIRAARLSAKLGFDIERQTADAMHECTDLLAATPPARMFDEVLKLFQGGYGADSFERLLEHDLLDSLFPSTAARMEQSPDKWLPFLRAGLVNTDRRVCEGLPITPAYLLAFLLWPRVAEHSLELAGDGLGVHEAIQTAGDELYRVQAHITSIPRRFSHPMQEIWDMQPRLEQYSGARALGLMESRRFRAAYDFLGLRATVEPHLRASADWWTKIQDADEQARGRMLENKPTVKGSWPAKQGATRKGRNNAGKGRRRRRPSRRRNTG